MDPFERVKRVKNDDNYRQKLLEEKRGKKTMDKRRKWREERKKERYLTRVEKD